MELQTLFEMEDIAVSTFKYHVASFVPDFQTKLAVADSDFWGARDSIPRNQFRKAVQCEAWRAGTTTLFLLGS